MAEDVQFSIPTLTADLLIRRHVPFHILGVLEVNMLPTHSHAALYTVLFETALSKIQSTSLSKGLLALAAFKLYFPNEYTF